MVVCENRLENMDLPGWPKELPRGVLVVDGEAWLGRRRLRNGDELFLRLESGAWDRGRFWKPPGVAWASLISGSRWISYILSAESVLRWEPPDDVGP